MIIQKLASAIRRQDWFQVLVEVLIVIVGIFLGLQVQNWYEYQSDRQLEQVYLQRLLEDSDASLQALERNFTFGDRLTDSLETVNQLMLNHQVSEGNRKEFSELYYGSRGYASMDVYLTTIDELISSGQVTLIQSQEIRNAIGILRKEYEVLDQDQTMIEELMAATYMEINDIIDTDKIGEIILNPLEELNRDSPLFRKLRMLSSLHQRHLSYNVRISEYLKEYREKLLYELEQAQ